jgi:curved DNA-binding protein CbpA
MARTMNNNNNDDDPYKILDIPFGESDKAVIKRAYRRMAMKYHPDVAAKDSTSTSGAGSKKANNERFIKINAAYELLSGKTGAQNGASGSSTASRGTGSSSSYDQPPHRRATSRERTSDRDYTSQDWKDFFPNDYFDTNKSKSADDTKYDTDGDSFSQIFSDLFEGASSAVGSASGSGSSGGGVLNDLIEFLEGSYGDAGGFGGVSSSKRADEELLRDILSSNNVDLIREEVDDTALLIQQLETKLEKVDTEMAQLNMEILSPTIRFTERELKEEEAAALKARKAVVEDYLKRGRTRLVKLQTRYKELRSGGGGSTRSSNTSSSSSSYGSSSSSPSSSSSGGTAAGRTSSTSTSSTGSYNGGSSSSGSGTNRSSAQSTTSSPSGGASGSSAGSGTGTSTREGFGSSGRRGSGRSRARAATTGTSTNTSSSSNNSSSNSPRSTTTSTSNASSSSRSPSSSSSSYQRPEGQQTASSPSAGGAETNTNTSSQSQLPPHRRSTQSSWTEKRADKKRLQELQVDDEFEKLKREMGL